MRPSATKNKPNVTYLFSRMVDEIPNEIAISQGGYSLTYKELNCLVDKVVSAIHSNVNGHDSKYLVINIKRSPLYVAAVLAAARLGIVYVPIGNGVPKSRLKLILNQLGNAVYLSVKGDSNQYNFEDDLCVDWRFTKNNKYTSEDIAPVDEIHDSAAYVIYTSGSTGEPKGVVVSQENLFNLVCWHIDKFQLKQGLSTSFISNLGFDASVWEMWPTLCSGGRLLIPEACNERSVKDLLDWLEGEELYSSFLVTPLAELAIRTGKINRQLKYLLTGGDRLKLPSNYEIPLGLRFFNNYGPTEATVLVTSVEVFPGCDLSDIGKPISNCGVRIFNDDYVDLTSGEVGEIGIEGAGVAIGYLNNIEETSKKFIDINGSRIYMTGDLGWIDDFGSLHYVGRIDSQIKVRGHRIEVSEVELVILNLNGISDVTVIVTEAGNLVAFLVLSENSSKLDKVEIIGLISEVLPSYSIPSEFVYTENISKLPNGKVDKKKLLENYVSSTKQGEALTFFEQNVMQTWKRAIGIKNISQDSDFFSIGGDSLSVVILELELEKFGLKFAFQNSIYEYSNFLEFCKHGVAFFKEENNSKNELAPPLSLNLKDALKYDPDFYTSGVFYIKGLSISEVTKRLKNVVGRHSAFRIGFFENNIILNNTEPSFKIDYVELGSSNFDQCISMLNNFSIDLKCPPLFKATIIDNNNSKYLHIKFSHLISDGWSIRSIENELNKPVLNFEPSLGQFSDYLWFLGVSEQSKTKAEVELWWKNQWSGTLEFPIFNNKLSKPESKYAGKYVSFIDVSLCQKVVNFSVNNSLTDYTFFLTAFGMLVSFFSSSNCFAIMSIDHARSGKYTHSIGYYMNVFPIKIDLTKGDGFKDVLNRTWSYLKSAKANSSMSNGFIYSLLSEVSKHDSYGSPCNAFFQMHKGFIGEDESDFKLIPKFSVPNELNEDLCLDIFPGSDAGMELHWSYSQDVFSPGEIEEIASKYFDLIVSEVGC